MIIDRSDVGTGFVLVQEASDGLDHPVSYFSKKFLKYQKNYSVVEKETLGLVLALEHFDVYLGSTPFKIKVYTDHNPLYSPLQRGEVPLYSSLRRFPIIPVTLHRWQHREGHVK